VSLFVSARKSQRSNMADKAKGDTSKQEKKTEDSKEPEKKNAEEPKEQELVSLNYVFVLLKACVNLD
jgi:hypothetical protein